MGKNYYSMYNKNKSEAETEEPVLAEEFEVKTSPSEKEGTVSKRKKIQKAVITDCTCLNVRATADITAPVVGLVSANEEVIIDENNSCDLWCAVELKNKTKGYSMRKFLKFL